MSFFNRLQNIFLLHLHAPAACRAIEERRCRLRKSHFFGWIYNSKESPVFQVLSVELLWGVPLRNRLHRLGALRLVMAQISALGLMDQPLNHTVVLHWKTSDEESEKVPLHRILSSFNLDAPRTGVTNFVMALKTDRFSMVPPLSQLARHWCPFDDRLDEDFRYHLLFSDIRQYAESVRHCGDTPIDLCPPGTPNGEIGSTHVNVQYMPPTDIIYALSSASKAITNLGVEVAVLRTQVRGLRADLGALRELLGAHNPHMVADLGLLARPARAPRAKARADPFARP